VAEQVIVGRDILGRVGAVFGYAFSDGLFAVFSASVVAKVVNLSVDIHKFARTTQCGERTLDVFNKWIAIHDRSSPIRGCDSTGYRGPEPPTKRATIARTSLASMK
jgi:hypothetical protein